MVEVVELRGVLNGRGDRVGGDGESSGIGAAAWLTRASLASILDGLNRCEVKRREVLSDLQRETWV